ncbi:MAG TPA: zinc-dependent metalloprotease, partial [Gemmatirosa sp.]
VALTFAATGNPGPIVEAVAPDGRAVTLREHVSLLPLPDGYRPREADPRVGYFGVRFQDYARPIDRPLGVTWISRHRLERGADGRIANPIVYYVDPGITEPVRTATMQGVKWWEDAFARAGLGGGLRVEWLPAGADPADARYNVVQWENRNERGWSIGGALGDPRTGEILKAMARMDSHRARTDANLYAALVGADATPAETAFVLARVRQVSAHEVGHTLGLTHNYIASSYGRASVMDYPAPRVLPRADGTLDLSQAYAVGPGDYDVWAIRWGYGIFPAASEADSLRAIVAEGLRKGYLYLSDADARPEFASDPRVNLWDDAATEDEYWTRTTEVRRLAMARFGERAVRPGDPIALVQERFVPLYFWHRFALNRLAKTLGGVEYANAVRGDGQQATRPVAPVRQRRALAAIAGALAPAELAVPDTVRTLLAPWAEQVTPAVELFGGRARPVFDELAAARTLAGMIVDAALQRDRAARLVQQHLHDPLQPGLGDVIDGLLDATGPRAETSRVGPARTVIIRDAALRRVGQRAVVDRLLALAADSTASPEVRALAEFKLGAVAAGARRALAGRAADVDARAHLLAVASDVERWQTRREVPRPTPALVAPPGDPFGEGWWGEDR